MYGSPYGLLPYGTALPASYTGAETSSPMFTLWKAAMFVVLPAAAGLSYARNKSITFAVLHAFVAPYYLAYRGVQAVTKPSRRSNGKRRRARRKSRRSRRR